MHSQVEDDLSGVLEPGTPYPRAAATPSPLAERGPGGEVRCAFPQVALSVRGGLDNLDLLLGEVVQLVHQAVDVPLRGLDLAVERGLGLRPAV